MHRRFGKRAVVETLHCYINTVPVLSFLKLLYIEELLGFMTVFGVTPELGSHVLDKINILFLNHRENTRIMQDTRFEPDGNYQKSTTYKIIELQIIIYI